MLTWRTGACRADMSRGTRANALRHERPRDRAARAHVRHRWRTGRIHVAQATRVHADAREGRHMALEGLACEGPMG